MGLALPLRPRSAFRLTGVLPSASRPCRPHFFVAPHPTTPNDKKGYLSVAFFYYWSGQWDSDPRHQPWQGCALPLSYTRIICEQDI